MSDESASVPQDVSKLCAALRETTWRPCENLTDTFKRWSGERIQAAGVIKAITAQNARYKQIIDTATEQVGAFASEKNAAEARADAADRALQTIGIALGSTDEWSDQQTMIADVTARASALAEELSRANSDMGMYRARADALEKELEGAHAGLTEVKRKLEGAKSALAISRADVAEWQQTASDTADTLQIRTDALAASRAEVERLRGAMAFAYWRPAGPVSGNPNDTPEFKALYAQGDVRVVYVNEGDFTMFEIARSAALAQKGDPNER